MLQEHGTAKRALLPRVTKEKERILVLRGLVILAILMAVIATQVSN
jgi:hypothetical protein